MNFDSWPSQGRIYIFAVRPRAAHWEGGVGATAVYIYTEYIEWRWRRGRSHSRSQHEIRLFSSGLQTDFGFLRDPPLAQSKESSPLTHHGGRGPKKKANFWLKKKVEEKKEGGFILIFHPSPHLAALRFPFHHSTFLRGRSSWSWILSSSSFSPPSFIKYIDLWRDSILFGGLRFVVAPCTPVTRSGSESTCFLSLSILLFLLFLFFLNLSSSVSLIYFLLFLASMLFSSSLFRSSIFSIFCIIFPFFVSPFYYILSPFPHLGVNKVQFL